MGHEHAEAGCQCHGLGHSELWEDPVKRVVHVSSRNKRLWSVTVNTVTQNNPCAVFKGSVFIRWFSEMGWPQ